MPCRYIKVTGGLHLDDMGVQVLGRDIGQLLQVVFFGEKMAKALHGLVIPFLGW